jgi:hypothetical protein
MVRITGQHRPDRGTIGRSGATRDYRMSTYDKAIAVVCGASVLRALRPDGRCANSDCGMGWNQGRLCYCQAGRRTA